MLTTPFAPVKLFVLTPLPTGRQEIGNDMFTNHLRIKTSVCYMPKYDYCSHHSLAQNWAYRLYAQPLVRGFKQGVGTRASFRHSSFARFASPMIFISVSGSYDAVFESQLSITNLHTFLSSIPFLQYTPVFCLESSIVMTIYLSRGVCASCSKSSYSICLDVVSLQRPAQYLRSPHPP